MKAVRVHEYNKRPVVDELMALTARGKVSLRTKTYPLEAVNDAMDDLESGRLRGRGILVPSRS